MMKNSFAKTSVKYFNCHDRQTKGNIVIYLFLEVFSKDYVRLYHMLYLTCNEPGIRYREL